MNERSIDIGMLVPGGIKPTDKVHHVTNDGTCSRCGKDTEDQVPLMLWSGQADDMLIYCEACCGIIDAEDQPTL